MPIIETRRGPVTLSEETRDQLVERIGLLESSRPTVLAFQRAGLGENVDLDLDGKRLVVEAIHLMRSDGDVDPQLEKLREYLIDELDAGE